VRLLIPDTLYLIPPSALDAIFNDSGTANFISRAQSITEEAPLTTVKRGSEPASRTREDKDGKPGNQKEAAGKPIGISDADESFLRESMKTPHISGTAQEREDAKPIDD
jgi:hypothetical protein